MRANVGQDAAIGLAAEKPLRPEVAVKAMGSQAAGMDDAPDGARFDEFAGAGCRPDLKTLGEIHREDAASFCLHLLDGRQMLEARNARFVDHEVLAGPHRLDGEVRPVPGYGGACDEVNRRVLEKAAPVGHARNVREALHEAGQRPGVIAGPEAQTLGADVLQAFDLVVDVPVIQADGGEAKLGVGSSRGARHWTRIVALVWISTAALQRGQARFGVLETPGGQSFQDVRYLVEQKLADASVAVARASG